LEYRPDAALVDIAMPDLDGYEVAGRLRKSLPDLLLIAVTGFAQDSDGVRARRAGFNHHLAKPVTVRRIEELFARASERGVRASE
jgi:two-component system, chemotaxis family, CheB/CheR fusion protein